MKENPLDSTTIEIIHKYIDRFCIRMNESPKEIEDFREEMTSKRMSGVRGWVSKGYTESDAVKKAIDSFGELHQIEEDLTELYRIKKVFSSNILKTAILLFMLGTFIVGWFVMWNEVLHYEVAKNAFDIVRQEMGTADQPVSEGMKERLKENIKSSISITGGLFEYKMI